MQIIIFTNRDLASNLFLNCLLPHISSSVVQIFLSDKVGKKTTALPPKALQELKFLEQTLPNEVVFPLLDAQNRALSIEERDTDAIREGYGNGTKLLTFNELSRKYSIPIEALNDVRLAENLARIAALAPDLVLSVRYGKIFGSDFLKIPKLGTINLHSGRLPQYRGVLPTFRALMNGDERLFPTLHYIEDGTIDTGSVIGVVAMKVEKEQSLLWHILHLYPQSVGLVVATIQQIGEGKRPLAEVQETEGAAYFTFPTDDEIAVFLEKWGKMSDFSEYTAFLRRYT